MWQRLKNDLIYGFLRTLLAAGGLLPRRLALGVGGALGGLFCRLAPGERRRAERNLALAFPELTERDRRRLAGRVFVSMGQAALEFMHLQRLTADGVAALVEAVEGREHMAAAHARGRGVLCLTAHLGNWEILPILTGHEGWPCAVIAQKLYDPRLDALLNRFRADRGVHVIQRGNVTGAVIRCLRANLLLGILNDQDTNVDSRWAPFFGRPAKTPVGLLRLARRTGAAVVPIFIARAPSGSNRVYIEPELVLPNTGDAETDLVEGARLCNAAIEEYVRRFPEQWVWFHDRWKNPPPDPEPSE